MKPRHIALTLALLVSAGLVLFGDREPEIEVVESVERRPAVSSPLATPAHAATRAPAAGPTVMRLIPREELIGDEDGEVSAFQSQNWNPPPPPAPPPPPPEPPAPRAPPLPFTFIGKTLGDGRWEIHLSQGDRVHTVRAGDVIDGAWRVDTVAPPVMTITYLPLEQTQQMNIGANE